MKPKIINVSLNDKCSNFSYPILIGNGLLSNCEEILKTTFGDLTNQRNGSRMFTTQSQPECSELIWTHAAK